MTGVLVDSNILLDIATNDPVWSSRSADQLRRAGQGGRMVLNPIICAELSVSHSRIEQLDARLPDDVFRREELPWQAAFLAGKAYLGYRRRGGERRSALPDFHIGAHAAIRGYRLLTRDRGRYATYFPTVDLISPQ